MKRGLLLLAILCLVGCRPYDKPEFGEIRHYESGYVIPLEGAAKKGQAKFESKDALEENKVAIKRIQIPHRWVQTGRWWWWGHYIDTVRLVVVNRSPVTREWTADEGGTSNVDQAIWLESRDSIGFSLGFNCTAFIDEQDTSTFLYWYPTTHQSTGAELSFDKSSTGLSHVMDSEVRARVQMLANTIAAQYDLDDLRARKAEILDAVRNGIPEVKDKDGNVVQERLVGTIEHFADRGITITNLGQFGGFAYEEPEIQTAINDTFVAQQEKVRTEAAFEAQAKKNERIELEAKGLAERARTIAKGEADAVELKATAEAQAIRSVAAATKEAGKDPLFIQIKQLEVESQRIGKWDGAYPKMMMGNAPNLLLNVPTTD